MSDENYEFDFGESDPTDTSPTPKPGKCHVLVESLQRKENSLQVNFSILAHEEGQGQRGKKSRTWLSFSGGAANRASQFCLATGIVPPDYFIQQKAAGNKVQALPMQASIGKTFCTTLMDDGEFNGMPSVKVGFDFTNPTSPKAEDYPRDMNYVGGATAQADAEEQQLDAALSSPAPAAPAPAPAAAPAIADDDIPF